MIEAGDVKWRSEDGFWGADIPLSQTQISDFQHIMCAPAHRQSSTLSGRGGVRSGVVTGIGRVVAKEYLRGGVFRKLFARRFFRWGAPRPEREFRLLKTVGSLGVNAPVPVAFHFSGSIFYRGWLFTKEIENYRSLAETAKFSEQELSEIINEAGRQLEILILNRLFHIDLHPGNVLIDDKRKVYILDFDKALAFTGAVKSLRELYIRRWRRAVIKHGLPDTLSELMCIRLRKVAVSSGNE